MKKLFTIMLAVLMLVTLAVPAFAATAATEKGSITINGVGTEAVYEIYQVLDLESYNSASGAYSYKVNADWAGFFATTEALQYVVIDDAGYVTWKAAEDDDTIAAFAKSALAYAQANGIDPVKSSTVGGDFVITGTTGVFSDLELGWYLVDSTVGALCGLTTTNPNAYINAKNGAPTIDKSVQEDSTEQWGDKNSADIGQTVYFSVTINVHAGAQNYVLHDRMTEAFKFLEVQNIDVIKPGTGTTTLTEGDEYKVLTAPGFTDAADDDTTDGDTFEVVFDKDFCDALETNDKIIVYYSAMLTRYAVQANVNEAWLTYGEEHETTHDTTTTHTYEIDIVKTDSQNTLLDGAQFKIYDAATGGNEIAVVPLETDADGNVTVYRRARVDETGVPIVVKGGIVKVKGFDNGTYYLEETVAPDGYNKLTARQKFIISDANLNATFNGTIFSTGSGVHVVNKSGSMLPETGGFGTTLFITIGAVVVLATGVILFTKKRMSQIAE